VLWFFRGVFAASLAVCLLVLPPLLLTAPSSPLSPLSSLSPLPPLSSSLFLASHVLLLLLLLLSRGFC
jgi:hypothetical protein